MAAPFASGQADVVNNALVNKSQSNCSFNLAMFGDEGVFTLLLSAPVVRADATVAVYLNGSEVAASPSQYQLYWLTSTSLAVKTLDKGNPVLPSSVLIEVDYTT